LKAKTQRILDRYTRNEFVARQNSDLRDWPGHRLEKLPFSAASD
jgi:hypothetical protein